MESFLGMIHVRAVSPADLTPDLSEFLTACSGVVNLVVLAGVATNPVGDSVEFDVIHAAANEVLAEVRRLGVDRRGSVIIEEVSASLSDLAAEERARERPVLSLSPIWEEAEARIRAGGLYSWSWFVLFAIAGVIAAVGIFSNSQILIVGAMVVGPEYAAIISLALSVTRRDRQRTWRSARALLIGFVFAVSASLAFSLAVRAVGLESTAFSLGFRPVSDMIDTPDAFSVIVATLAGIVGVVSIVEARTGALIGVFISVTTIPAAADIGVSIAFQNWREARGSLVQLLLNVTILIVVGAVGLVAQRSLWRRVESR